MFAGGAPSKRLKSVRSLAQSGWIDTRAIGWLAHSDNDVAFGSLGASGTWLVSTRRPSFHQAKHANFAASGSPCSTFDRACLSGGPHSASVSSHFEPDLNTR